MLNNFFNGMPTNTNNNFPALFDNFMQRFRGQDPQNIINELVKNGKISQSQLNMVQGSAEQMKGFFENMRSKYNF